MRLLVVCWNNRWYNHHETASASGMMLTLKSFELYPPTQAAEQILQRY